MAGELFTCDECDGLGRVHAATPEPHDTRRMG
jgi:hypothetical protein